jgi:Sulfotransferase family
MADADEIDAASRFFFVHVQKTAGTALFTRLKRQFGTCAVYPNAGDGDVLTVMPQLSVDVLKDRWRVRRDEVRVVTGHFPLCTTELLGERFTTLTIVREPVERTLSYLRHHRLLTREDRDKPLEAIYDDDFRYHALIHNHMVKMFSLTLSEMTDGVLTPVEFRRDHLDRAKARLATVDVLGLQEGFDEFCATLQQQFGWNLGAPVHANRTEPVVVSSSFRDRIAQDNSMDVELYAHAERLCEQRRSAGVRT